MNSPKKESPEVAYIGLGSNLGNREENLKKALAKIAAHPRISLKQVSSFYLTSPVGKEEQPWFLNAVTMIETTLEAEELLFYLQQIEQEEGRVRQEPGGPRLIDLDLLLYNQLVLTTENLTLPHPRLKERLFVLVPLEEIAPDLKLPGGEKISILLSLLQKFSEQQVLLFGDAPGIIGVNKKLTN